MTEEDWRSHYEQGEPPRKTEILSALDHMAVSMWDNPEILRRLSSQYPSQLGTFIAALEMVANRGIWLAATGPEGHFNVWGRRYDLQASVRLSLEPV